MRNEYRVIRSRRRTVAIEITREAEVLVRAPLWYTDAQAAALVAARAEWIAVHLKRQKQRLAAYPEPSEEQLRLWRAKAKELLPKRVAYYSKKMGVVPTGIRITSAKTRFGSCSGKNSLSFSCRLMQYPAEAIDYVVVHELAHIRHHNHSAAFYAFVERILPDHRARRALLRNETANEE